MLYRPCPSSINWLSYNKRYLNSNQHKNQSTKQRSTEFIFESSYTIATFDKIDATFSNSQSCKTSALNTAWLQNSSIHVTQQCFTVHAVRVWGSDNACARVECVQSRSCVPWATCLHTSCVCQYEGNLTVDTILLFFVVTQCLFYTLYNIFLFRSSM